MKFSKIDKILSDVKEKGFFHLLSANIFIQAAAFLTQLFVAGILDVEDVGRIKVLTTYLSVFSVISSLGLNVSTLKLCSEKGIDEQSRKEFFSSAFWLTIIASILIYLLLVLISSLGILSSDVKTLALFPLAMFPLISNAIFMLFVAYSQANKQIKLMSGLTGINKILSIIIILILTYYFKIEGYWIAYNAGFILMILFCIIYFNKNISPINKFGIKAAWIKHAKYAKPSIWANLFSELGGYLDILLIGFFAVNSYDTGLYGFALTLTVLLRIAPSTIQQISSPYFSGFGSQRKLYENAFRKYNKILIIIVLISLALSLILIPILLNLIFGDKFAGSVYYFRILAISWSIRQLVHIQVAVIFGAGNIKYNAYVSMITVLCNLILFIPAIYFYQLQGLAFATLISSVIFYLSSYFYYRKTIAQLQ